MHVMDLRWRAAYKAPKRRYPAHVPLFLRRWLGTRFRLLAHIGYAFRGFASGSGAFTEHRSARRLCRP